MDHMLFRVLNPHQRFLSKQSVANDWILSKCYEATEVDQIEHGYMRPRGHMDQQQYVMLTKTQYLKYKGVGEGGGGRGGTCLPTFKSGGHKWVCAPPTLLGRAIVLISLFAHILWLKTQFFQNFLGSLCSPTLINQYFLNFANLKLQNNFSYILL